MWRLEDHREGKITDEHGIVLPQYENQSDCASTKYTCLCIRVKVLQILGKTVILAVNLFSTCALTLIFSYAFLIVDPGNTLPFLGLINRERCVAGNECDGSRKFVITLDPPNTKISAELSILKISILEILNFWHLNHVWSEHIFLTRLVCKITNNLYSLSTSNDSIRADKLRHARCVKSKAKCFPAWEYRICFTF